MSDRIKGQRDSHGDNWSWGPPGGGGPAQGSGRPPPLPWRPILLVAVALVLIATGVGLLVLVDDDGGNSSVNGNTTPTSSPRPTRTDGGDAASPGTTAGPTRTPAQAGVRLFAWSRQGNEWVDGTLPAGAGYKEGDAIPVLLQIDGATSGSFYETIVRYQCGTDRGAGLDFLASPAKVDSESVLIDPAPGRARPDSSVPIPNDPNITYDDGFEGRFQLWEGTFQQSLQGPLPPAPCERQKEFHLITVAASNTVSLGWAAHLASARDWGEGKGSASAGAPLTIEVTIGGVVDALLTVSDGAIAP
jgi:hypothetical protein